MNKFPQLRAKDLLLDERGDVGLDSLPLNGVNYTIEVRRKEWKYATTSPRSINLTCSGGWGLWSLVTGHYHQVTRDMEGSL